MKNAFWLLIPLLFSPFIMAEESSCPADIQAALKSIEQHLKNKQWIYIYHDDCPQIQAELIAKADQIVKAKNFENYIPLMSKDTMRIIRNTFFAVKGHEFQENSLKEHFQKYSWYKPVNGKKIILSEVENRYVDFLKNIEDSLSPICESELRCRKPPSLPENVNIVVKGDKTLLRFKTNTVDITPRDIGEGWSRYRYHVYPVKLFDSVLVCEQRLSGDAAHIENITLYSTAGKKNHSFQNINESWINGLGTCPVWIDKYPDLFFSHNFNGCCGAIWNVLVLLNKRLEPITVVDCHELGCMGSNLFDAINNNHMYFFISASGTQFSVKKSDKNYTYYEYAYYSDSLINDIWIINQDGTIKLVSEAKKHCKRINETQSGYEIECEKPEPSVDFFQMTKVRGTWGAIITSLQLEDKLLLFHKDNNWKHATSVIPLIRK